MKKLPAFLPAALLLSAFSAAQSPGKTDVFNKANNAVNKVNNIIAVFQPYLLKARQIFYDAKQLGTDVKNSSKATFGKNGSNNSQYNNTGNGQFNNNYDTSQYSQYNNNNTTYQNNSGTYTNTTNNNSYNQNSNSNYNNNSNQNNNNNDPNSGVQNYLPNQNLPINNPATVNNDGTGNWGNQNNGLYGNCLDVMTGTVMGLGEAEDNPKSVDVIFIAANESYQIWTPNYARNEVAAQYSSRSTYESVSKWSDVNETEVASTKITLSQFDQIQNNSQILNAAKNAQDYSSSITEFGKLDGKVYAVRAELEDRTVYGLIAIVKQVGTDGSNGYLRIKIKSQGVAGNTSGQVDANAYVR